MSVLKVQAETAAQAPGGDPLQEELLRLRGEIDELDRRILELISRRGELALATVRCKAARGEGGYDLMRERSLLERLAQRNRGPLSDEALLGIFREVVSACRALQEPLKVAFLGPEGTFSHQVARDIWGSGCRFLPQGSIDDVFDQVERGNSSLGVVPVENSSEGGVNATLDRFLTTDLSVCGETYARIRHCLISACRELGQVERVYSHPQALNQCRGWLRRNLPRALPVEVSSTAAAVRQAAGHPKSAAIGPRRAAELNGLEVLAADIQDYAHNTTRFLILSRMACPPTGRDKTSLLFTLPHRPGTLFEALGHLSRAGLNLTHIQSRPVKHRPWEYVFFVDLEGHREDPQVAPALSDLAQCVERLQILGSYPRGNLAPQG